MAVSLGGTRPSSGLSMPCREAMQPPLPPLLLLLRRQ
jgi:hypothetical protein